MTEKVRRGAKEGISFGIIAGVIFAMVEILASIMMGNPALLPLRMFASVLLGQGALQGSASGGVMLLGIIVHLVLSGAFGLLYGMINGRLSTETETRWGRQVGLGLLFGALVWLVNFQLIARALYPWFLNAPQFLQMLMHAMFFGLPLALMYAAAERRIQHVGRAHRHA